MNYGMIKPCDIANGPGVRVSLFVSGCTHHCDGCFQPETWDFNYGKPYTNDTLAGILQLLKPNYISGLTILGGEPLEPQNLREIFCLVYAVIEKYPKKTIWIYTGSTFEELKQRNGVDRYLTAGILYGADILVDGSFIKAQKDIRLRFRGSSNQRIIDLRGTMSTGKIVIWDGKGV